MAELQTHARVLTSTAFATSTVNLKFEAVFQTREQLLAIKGSFPERETELCRSAITELTATRGIADATTRFAKAVQVAAKIAETKATFAKELSNVETTLAIVEHCLEGFFENPPLEMEEFLQKQRDVLLEQRCDAVQVSHTREAKLAQIVDALQRIQTAKAARAASLASCGETTDVAVGTVEYLKQQNVSIEAQHTAGGTEEVKKNG